MFRTVRRIKNAISEAEARNLLKNGRRGALALNGDDGYPYAIPMNFYYDEDENRLYFHSGKAGYKIEAIRRDGKACFTLWDDGVRDEGDWAMRVASCVAFGRAYLVEDRALTLEKVRKLAQKYYPKAEEAEEELLRSGNAVQLIALDIEHVTGKRVHER